MKTLPEIIKVEHHDDNRIYFRDVAHIRVDLYLTYLDNGTEKTALYVYDFVSNVFEEVKPTDRSDYSFAPSPTSIKMICLYLLEALASGKMVICHRRYYSTHLMELWEVCFHPEDASDIEAVIGHIRNRIS